MYMMFSLFNRGHIFLLEGEGSLFMYWIVFLLSFCALAFHSSTLLVGSICTYVLPCWSFLQTLAVLSLFSICFLDTRDTSVLDLPWRPLPQWFFIFTSDCRLCSLLLSDTLLLNKILIELTNLVFVQFSILYHKS